MEEKPKRKYVKRISPEARSAAGRAAWATKLANGTANVGHNGGRPKGSKNSHYKEKIDYISMSIIRADHATFTEYAKKSGISICALMHQIAERLRADNPEGGGNV